MSFLIPLGLIDPNPFQPRAHFDEQALQELAADIEKNGLLQPPVGRVVDAEGRAVLLPERFRSPLIGLANASTARDVLERAGMRVQLAAGERRLRAYRLLAERKAKPERNGQADLFGPTKDFGAIPILLQAFTDERMAVLAWSENAARKNITAVEEARGIERMTQAFGWTHEQVAEKLGLTRPTVSNKLRLLRLPDAVLDLLDAGEISERQARALVAATEISEEDWAFIEGYGYLALKSFDDLVAMAQRGVAAEHLSETIARTIERLPQAKERAEERAEREAKEARALERTRQAYEKKVEAGEAPKRLPKTSDLKYDEYENLKWAKPPKGCTAECPCRGLACDHGGEEVPICTDPKRFKRLQREQTKRQRSKYARRAEAFTARFHTECVDEAGGLVWTPGAARLLAHRLRHSLSVKDTRAAAAAMVEAGAITGEQAETLAELAAGTWDRRGGSVDVLAALPKDVALRFLVEALLCYQLRYMVEYKRDEVADIEALFEDPAPLVEEGSGVPTLTDWARGMLGRMKPEAILANLDRRKQALQTSLQSARDRGAEEEADRCRETLADVGRASQLVQKHVARGEEDVTQSDTPTEEVSAETSAEAPQPDTGGSDDTPAVEREEKSGGDESEGDEKPLTPHEALLLRLMVQDYEITQREGHRLEHEPDLDAASGLIRRGLALYHLGRYNRPTRDRITLTQAGTDLGMALRRSGMAEEVPA